MIIALSRLCQTLERKSQMRGVYIGSHTGPGTLKADGSGSKKVSQEPRGGQELHGLEADSYFPGHRSPVWIVCCRLDLTRRRAGHGHRQLP
jgi:hypothetical protein